MSAVSPFGISPPITVAAGETWHGSVTLRNPSPFYYSGGRIGWSGTLPPGSEVRPFLATPFTIPAYSDVDISFRAEDNAGLTVPADVVAGSYHIEFHFYVEDTDMPGLPLPMDWTARLPVSVTGEGAPVAPPAEFVPPYNIPVDVWNQLTPEHQAAILAAAAGQPVPIPEPTGELPWYMNIQTTLTDFLTNSYNTLTNSIGGLTGMLGVVSSAIAAGFAGLWTGLVGQVQALVTAIYGDSITKLSAEAAEAMSGTQPWINNLKPVITSNINNYPQMYLNAINTNMTGLDTIALSEVKARAEKLASDLLGVHGVQSSFAVLMEFLGLGQTEGFLNVMNEQLEFMGVNQVMREIYSLQVSVGLLAKYRLALNAQYQNNLPGYSDLINMVVKEKIPLSEFKDTMKLQGYNERWSQLLWDAHFYAPTLTDILTAWRRGLIDETRVDELMILVDLDPTFKQVFDTRKYIDPPVTMARWMFETGAISEERVREIVHRAGYNEADSVSVVDFITRFQERRFRARLMTALMTGITYGAYSDEDLRAAVRENGYTDAVADIMIRMAEVRRKTEEARITRPKPRLLSVGELKRGYMHNVVTEDALRTELMNRGYELGQVDALVSVMEADKVVTDAGGKKVALTVAEMKAAYQYGTITEDYLRQTLLLRGLDLSEVDILINTWKKQWGVEAG